MLDQAADILGDLASPQKNALDKLRGATQEGLDQLRQGVSNAGALFEKMRGALQQDISEKGLSGTQAQEAAAKCETLIDEFCREAAMASPEAGAIEAFLGKVGAATGIEGGSGLIQQIRDSELFQEALEIYAGFIETKAPEEMDWMDRLTLWLRGRFLKKEEAAEPQAPSAETPAPAPAAGAESEAGALSPAAAEQLRLLDEKAPPPTFAELMESSAATESLLEGSQELADKRRAAQAHLDKRLQGQAIPGKISLLPNGFALQKEGAVDQRFAVSTNEQGQLMLAKEGGPSLPWDGNVEGLGPKIQELEVPSQAPQ